MTSGEPNAARAYREVMAGLDLAAAELRDADRARAAELATELVGLQDATARAAERAALTRLGVDLAWEDALEALWTESWLQLRPRPDPPPDARPPADLAALDEAVQAAAAELLAALRRRRFGLPGR
ncbi:hypothetical protein [Pseudonocardia sp.]|uniref:hypothetical protein n=1 Tax=Pseudonocardia sp. TaxID=60912 RepID=UPI00260966A7|nr:hypothetical protein [Pseudonocardia sp.]